MRYYVEIVETLSRTEEIDAENRDDAISVVTNKYKDGDIVLDAEDFVDVEFNCDAEDTQ